MLKISVVSLALLINAVSFGMLTIDQEVLRHIFVFVPQFKQNQLKNSCKTWHKIGTKKAPNMYSLINYESFHPSKDDWSYIMMNAAWDGNVEVMKKILKHTDQRQFDYDFTTERSFRLCDMPVIKGLHVNGNWTKEAPEQFKELDLTSNSRKEAVAHTPLFRACFVGDIDEAKQELEKIICYQKDNKPRLFEGSCIGPQLDPDVVSRRIEIRKDINDSLYIAIYNDNPHCIKLLSSQRNKREPEQKTHLDVLFMAISKHRKHAFRALVTNNGYGCLNDVRLDYAYGRTNTTTLDEMYKKKKIPNIVEYIALYKELGGQNLEEMGYRDDYDSIVAFPIVALVDLVTAISLSTGLFRTFSFLVAIPYAFCPFELFIKMV